MAANSPIFVVGMNGSGTGALTRSLAQHDHVYAFPGESRIFVTYMRRYPVPIANLEQRRFSVLLNEIAGNSGLTRWNGDEKLPLVAGADGLEQSLAGALDSAFRYFAGRDGKARWVEKTPFNAHYIESLVAHFPDAKIVHIIRDARDAALSFERRFGFNPVLSVHRWKHLIREARRQGAKVGPERYLEVRYEALTETPAEVLQSVCDFTELEFQDAMLVPSRPSNKPMLARNFVANSEKWRTEAAPALVAQMDGIAGAMLGELGYAVENPPGDSDLSPSRVALLRTVDAANTALRYVKRVFSGDGTLIGKGRTLFGIFRSSIQSRIGRH